MLFSALLSVFLVYNQTTSVPAARKIMLGGVGAPTYHNCVVIFFQRSTMSQALFASDVVLIREAVRGIQLQVIKNKLTYVLSHVVGVISGRQWLLGPDFCSSPSFMKSEQKSTRLRAPLNCS